MSPSHTGGPPRRSNGGSPARSNGGFQGGAHEGCLAVREVLNRVGDKWSVFIVGLLQGGPKRFGELKRAIEGISQRMLTLTLRGLERDGLVIRTQYPTIPPRVDYALTPLGKTLLEPVNALARWSEKHRYDIQGARDLFDGKRPAPKGSAEKGSASKGPVRQRVAG